MKLAALMDYLEKHYDANSFREDALNGLQVEGCEDVHRVACAVSASLEAIEHAASWGADVLIVHHGFFWGRGSRPIVGTFRRKLKLLLDARMSLIAYHLPMDAHRETGNNWAAARALGWQNLQPFGEYAGQMIGVRGNIPAQPAWQFLEAVKNYYQVDCPRIAGDLERVICQVAMISGGAHKSFSSAIESGVDAFITGTADEPNWYEAQESGRLFIGVGHSASERIGPEHLARHLHQELGLTTTFIKDQNPF